MNSNKQFSHEEKTFLGKTLCDRNFSIGANDVLFVEYSDSADAKMIVIEPDGSEADMCGNGIRCVASYLNSIKLIDSMSIETKAGIKNVEKQSDMYRVNMGKVIDEKVFFERYINFKNSDNLYDVTLNYNNIGFLTGSIVYTGEPNIVFVVDNIDVIDLDKWGKNISEDITKFPQGICTVLVEPIDEGTIKARFYEKGVYSETLACGTGATAAAYVSNYLKKTSKNVIKVIVKGGEIFIEPGEETYMIGEANKVFKGEICL